MRIGRLGAIVVLTIAGSLLSFCDSVDIFLPVSIDFVVMDIHASTAGMPDPTTLSFSNADLSPGSSLRISLKADTENFTKPSSNGDSIPVNYVSWSTSNATNGVGYPGTLGFSSFSVVYQSVPDASSGSVDLSWTLESLDQLSIRAGAHFLSATWKVESIVP